LPSFNQTNIKYGITLARKIRHQNAIEKTKTNNKKPKNFIISNFAQRNNKKKEYQNF
tara:strand:- start:29368 stop:29538 length:171 start_codon:yes stop_codon:yes gene_type:complete